MRNNELMRNYREKLAEAYSSGRSLTRTRVIDQTLAGSRPGYDVSYDYVLRMMYTMVRDGKPCPLKRPLKRAMWDEIRRHVESVVSRRGCPIAEAVSVVLAEKKASRYFLSPKQASKIIYHEKSRARRCCRP